MPNQYARVKNLWKEKEIIKDSKYQAYELLNEFLEEAMKSSSIFETDEDVDYEYWSSNHNAHSLLSEFQLRYFSTKIYLIYHKHERAQKWWYQMVIIHLQYP
jgi:hypothetical protein